MAELLNVDTALERILAQAVLLPDEEVSLTEAYGRVLAEKISAEDDWPPFDCSAVDGYAVRSEDVATAQPQQPVRLVVSLDVLAGQAAQRDLQAGEAARIMTGAPVPRGADAVIMVEDTNAGWGNNPSAPSPTEIAVYRAAQVGQNIRPKGENVHAGQALLSPGRVLRPVDVALLATMGLVAVRVHQRARVAIISTGDELLEPGQALSEGKIYDANRYALEGLVREIGGIALSRLPIARDRVESVREVFRQALALRPHVIISTAGVSVGAADVVRLVLDELGQVDLWRVNLRPGKPLTFGHLRGMDGLVSFFGLPGNPVSALVTFDVLVKPALLRMMGRQDKPRYALAIAGERMTSDGRRSYLRVRLRKEQGHIVAYSTGTQSSGALVSMVMADALMIIPEDVLVIERGTEVQVKYLNEC
ncbi:MAG: molybdopterin molybdotransferase MoeA [Anaerolineae bacterium]|nr:molybdopterin molybdotransferase MoeA [Anaerolineae bacterium]